MPQLKDVMVRDVATIKADSSLDEAMQIMKERDVGALPVYDGDHLVGILSEVDVTSEEMAAAINAKVGDPSRLKVRHAMTGGVYYSHEDQEVEEAVRFMQRHQIHHLPILGQDKRLVGIVSLRALTAS